jgi:hypothetical protein
MPFVSTKEISMKRMLAIAVGVGLATVVGAQQKPVTSTNLLSAQARTKGAVTAPPVISTTQNDRSTTIVYDISGQQSWDSLYDSSNTILYVPIPAGKLMTGIGWDVGIATVGGSWLSEARIYFDGSDRDGYGLFLTPGVADTFAGTGYYSSPVIDLTDNGIPDIPIQADGQLWIELYEGFDDVPDAVDADWLNVPSTLTIVYGDAPAPRCPIWVEDFDSGVWPPAGWTVIDNTTTGLTWNTSSAFTRGNLVPGGAGECAAIDSDYYGLGPVEDGELWSAPFDVPAAASTIEWDQNYTWLLDNADVDISTDGGGSWTNLLAFTATTTGHITVDLSGYAGMTGVMIRFHYYNADYAWYWQVDNFGLYPSATAAARNAGSNPNSYTVSGAPIMGETMTASIDVASTGHTFGKLFGYSGPLTYTLGSRTILVDFTDVNGELLSLAPAVGPIATYDLLVPTDCAVAGFGLSTQAVHFGGGSPWVLSNAQDLVLGY